MLDAVISSKRSYLLLCPVGKCKVQIVLLSSSFLLCYLISFISILILALAFSCTFRFFLFVKSLPLCLIKFFIFIKKWSIDMCTSRSLIICTDSQWFSSQSNMGGSQRICTSSSVHSHSNWIRANMGLSVQSCMFFPTHNTVWSRDLVSFQFSRLYTKTGWLRSPQFTLGSYSLGCKQMD